MKIIADTKRTGQRWKQLSTYLENHVMRHNEMICESYHACKSSHNSAFYEGQVHHLGKYYDIFLNDKPLRIAVIGQEYGCPPALVSLKDRYKIVMGSAMDYRFKAYENYKARNPHMKGTTSVLRLLFGKKLGADRDREFITVNNNPEVHLFDCFALTNYLLCSAVERPGSKRGRSSRTMKENCRRHFLSAIRILEPNVMIIQGKGFWSWIKPLFDNVESITAELHSATLNDSTMWIASFSHPSSHGNQNWGVNEKTEYLGSKVEPTVRMIRKQLFE